MRSTQSSTLQDVLDELEAVEQTGSDKWKARCPAHDDNNPSLSVTVGHDYPVLLHCHAGCDFSSIADELDSLSTSWAPWEGTEVDRYTYESADGDPLFDVVRFEMRDEEHPACGDKDFRQQAHLPNHEEAGENGCPPGYVWGRKKHDIDPVLYRLPEVREAADAGEIMFVVEGEKDVHTLEEWGFTATTNPQGTGEWKTQHTEALSGARVVVLPDNDSEGREHGRMIAQEVLPAVESVRVVSLPDLPKKGDVTDWAQAGGTAERLKELVEEEPPLDPAPNGHEDSQERRVFWYVNDDEGKIKIDRSRLIRFLEARGFGKLYQESDLESTLVRVVDQVVHRTSVERIKDFVLHHVRETIQDGDGLPLQSASGQLRHHGSFSTQDVEDALLRGANVYFSSSLFEFLSPMDLEFHRDTADKAFFYFQNGFVEVTEESFQLRPYSELDGVIWRDEIIPREFEDLKEEDPGDWDWGRFLYNVTGRDSHRHDALRTSIGYLLHGYKDPARAKAIAFVDEEVTDVPSGRSGKSLVGEGISHMVPAVRVDAKNFSFESRFRFQDVELDTQVLEFNDAPKGFEFERLFSAITDDMQREKKGKDSVTIPFRDSPKFLLSTNYVIEGDGPSFEDRIFQVEFHPHYDGDHRPVNDFEERFFEEWSGEQWSRFDNIMIYCVREYLRKGLHQYRHVNLEKRRLRQQTSIDFANFIRAKEPGWYEKKALFESFTEAYEGDYEWLTQRKFTRWCNQYGRIFTGEKLNDRQSGSTLYIHLPDLDKQSERK